MRRWGEAGNLVYRSLWESVCPRHLSVIRNLSSETTMDQPNHPPEPIPNRPLRGQKPPPHSASPSAPKFAPTPRKYPNTSLLSDEAFLDKFKLGPPPKNLKGEDRAIEDEESNSERHRSKEDPTVPESADKIFKEMKESGLVPNAVAMLDGLCKDGLVQEALMLFNTMREKGSFPDVVVYTAVVEGFCKAHQLDEALRVFRKMQNNGVTPNAFSYGVLIRGLCLSDEKLDEAVEYSIEMVKAGHSPNMKTFVGLVDAICKLRGVDEAHAVVSKLSNNGFVLDHKLIGEYLDKNAPMSSDLPQAIFGKRQPRAFF